MTVKELAEKCKKRKIKCDGCPHRKNVMKNYLLH